MRVLVTGGAGYIGSAVVEELLRRGHGVVVYDSLVKGHRAAVDERATFIHADLGDSAALERALGEQRVEAVVHMAAASLVGESVVDPGKYYRENVSKGIALLDATVGAGIQRLVFSSTAAVYGEPARQPIEETDPTSPTNTYGETKLAFERALAWYGRAHGLRSVSLRYFNAAGATDACGEDHTPETHLIPLVLQVAAGRRSAITVFGDDYATRDGTCVRDYIHVADLAVAHVLALEATALAASAPSRPTAVAAGDSTAGGGAGRGRTATAAVAPASPEPGFARAYNLGCGGEGFTVREVVDVARRVTGHPIPVEVGPRRAGDPAVLVASSERIQRELGWRPERQDLETIVASAWSWLRAHPGGLRA